MSSYFAFRVQLLEAEPPIWRSFLLKKTATFRDLHHAIQDACGWKNCHMHSFHGRENGPVIAGTPGREIDRPDPDSKTVKLDGFFSRAGQSCFYQYDFGDSWWHKVKLTEIAEEKGRFMRRLTGGERAFPPEDCGGIPGYEICIAIRRGEETDLDPEEVEERKAWLGKWQPEEFDLAAAKRSFDE